MENEYSCPLCSSKEKCKIVERDNYSHFHCEHYNVDFFLHTTITDIYDRETRERIFDLIVEYLLERPQYNDIDKTEKWHFNYYPEKPVRILNEEKPYYINVAHMLNDYPETIQEKADRVLINLCRKYHNYDDLIYLFGNEYRLLFEHEYNNQGNPGIIRLMCEMGLLSDRGSCLFAISANGWQRIYDLQAHKKEKKQGFIAMAFREETKPIREAIQNGIENAGYSPLVIDEKEHNNQIVPEIFYEIERSKFVVVDVTYPNYGAYYEAGYAQALGKQVIICCREQELKSNDSRPHFDISQKSMVVWDDEKDLVVRLTRRIEATVKEGESNEHH